MFLNVFHQLGQQLPTYQHLLSMLLGRPQILQLVIMLAHGLLEQRLTYIAQEQLGQLHLRVYQQAPLTLLK
jgi:hypothetical protein